MELLKANKTLLPPSLLAQTTLLTVWKSILIILQPEHLSIMMIIVIRSVNRCLYICIYLYMINHRVAVD